LDRIDCIKYSRENLQDVLEELKADCEKLLLAIEKQELAKPGFTLADYRTHDESEENPGVTGTS
jgi:hypothetical protein